MGQKVDLVSSEQIWLLSQHWPILRTITWWKIYQNILTWINPSCFGNAQKKTFFWWFLLLCYLLNTKHPWHCFVGHLKMIAWCYGAVRMRLINAPQNLVLIKSYYVAVTSPLLALSQTRAWSLGAILLFHFRNGDKRDLSLISDTRIVGWILHWCSFKTMSKKASRAVMAVAWPLLLGRSPQLTKCSLSALTSDHWYSSLFNQVAGV